MHDAIFPERGHASRVNEHNHHGAFHTLMPARLRSRFDDLTRFLVVCVDRVALGIVQHLGAHRDTRYWVGCQRNLQDPDDRSPAGGRYAFFASGWVVAATLIRGWCPWLRLLFDGPQYIELNLFAKQTGSRSSFGSDWEWEGDLRDHHLCE